MKRQLLKLHKDWLRRGEFTSPCLCASLPEECLDVFEFLHPTAEDRALLVKENKPSRIYWGGGECFEGIRLATYPFTYTPLRQSLVLLLAEIIDDPFYTDNIE